MKVARLLVAAAALVMLHMAACSDDTSTADSSVDGGGIDAARCFTESGVALCGDGWKGDLGDGSGLDLGDSDILSDSSGPDARVCVDEDGDGYGSGCAAGDDCDDWRDDRWDQCPPFRISVAHPRLYLDAARVQEIRQAAAAGVPLNGSAFPAERGRLRFDLYPIREASTNYNGIFDHYDSARAHLFVRHNGSTTTSAALGVQVALQPAGGASYVAARNFTLAYDSWHTIEVAWNAAAHSATISVNGVASSLTWRVEGGNPVEWRATDQLFVMRGPHGIDNVQLFDSDLPGAGAQLVSYEMSALVGGRVSDSSGNDIDALVSRSARVGPRSSGVSDKALWLEATSLLRIAALSPLTEAWIDTYAAAASHAGKLVKGTHSVDPILDHPDRLIELSRSIGLAYLVTGEARFLQAALAYADLLLATAANQGNDFTCAGRAEAMGLLYDYFFTEMTATTAAGGSSYALLLRDAILALVREWSRYICGNNNALTAGWRCADTPHPDFISGHSHQNDTEMTAALMAIVDESPEAENVLRDMHDIFVRGFNPARAWISIDGGHHMGWSYAGTYTYLDSIVLWQQTANVPMAAAWQAARIYSYIYGLRSDERFPASGDGTFAKAQSQQLASFALWGASQFNDAYARSYYEQWVRPSATGIRDQELFLWRDGVVGQPFANLPLSRHFRNAGQVVMRESWDFKDSSLVEFKSTSFATHNHHHRDQNAFSLFYKAPLLVDSGYYDSYGTSHWHNYYTRTIAHNTLTIWDPDEEFRSSGNVVSNDGGQLIPPNGQLDALQVGGAWHLDGVMHFADGGDYSFAEGDASMAYSADKLQQDRGFVRRLLFLRQPSFWSRPVLVIFDEAEATAAKANLVKRFLLHTVNEPEPLGGAVVGPGQYTMPNGPIRIRNGGGMVLVQTLLPSGPVITKVGGQNATNDYRFMVPDAATGALTNFPLVSEPNANQPAPGSWRVEVRRATPAQKEHFLHVISIADDDPSLAPPSSELLTTVGGVACFLGGSVVAAFKDSATAAPDLSIRVPSTPFRVLASGFAPGGRYAASFSQVGGGVYVTLVASAGGSLVASTGGVLDFSSP